jgi:hypothetical protein
MSTAKKIAPELLAELQRDREKIAAELPELRERGKWLEEAAAENSLTGHLRRAIHRSGRPLKKIAAESGLDVFVLCDFLEGTTNLRSDVLDRLAQAAGAVIQMERAVDQASIDAALDRVRVTAGMLGWTGDAETVERLALDPEFGVEESP